MIPIAAYLAGALLTLLLPVLLLIALAVWYWKVSVRVPADRAGSEAAEARTATPPTATSAGDRPPA